jgi:hypothetical protein
MTKIYATSGFDQLKKFIKKIEKLTYIKPGY